MKHKWQRKKSQRDHGDDWLMTYADMITLLLCFFVVFLLASTTAKKSEQKPEEKPPQEIVTSVEEPQPEPAPPPPPAQPEIPEQPSIIMGNLPFHDPAEEAGIVTEKSGEQKMEAQSPPPIQTSAPTEQKGDRITTLEMSSAAFFDSGSATLSESGKGILKDVARKIGSDAYKDYQVTVEGHTDDSPIKTPLFPSNWELSTARASAVVHYFLQSGIAPQRLRAAGYADTFPKLPNRDATGNPVPENQAQNRRVVIKLEKIEAGR